MRTNDPVRLSWLTALLAAEGIVAGNVAAEPLVEQRMLACTRCEFQGVCRFDRALNRVRPVESVLPRLATSEGDTPEEPA